MGDPSWGCASATSWFHSFQDGTQQATRYEGTCLGSGGVVVDQVRIPADFPASNHTLLGWRWDSLDTEQIYTSCVDVSVVSSGASEPEQPEQPETPSCPGGDLASCISTCPAAAYEVCVNECVS